MPAHARDRWSDWLAHGRSRGVSAAYLRKQGAQLRRIRDRVLRNADVREGARVLDVGTGTGLLALEAYRRAGRSGLVVGVDISEDALRDYVAAAGPAANGDARPVHVAAGDAQCLPVRDEAVDVVLTRSVLIYVADRAEAIAEMHRVLRAGGVAAIFEPINAVSQGVRAWAELGGDDEHRDRTDRVVGHLEARSAFLDRMRGFDEHDLMAEFASAGFSAIDLVLEYHHEPRRRYQRWEAASLLSVRPNPGTVSYEEAARAVLGDEAEEHLERQFELLSCEPVTEAWAVAYLTARRDAPGSR